MREFQKRHPEFNFFYSRYMIIIFCIAIVFALYTVHNAYRKYENSKYALELANTELNKLENRDEALNLELAELQTVEGMESEVRERFGLVKKGEKLIVLIEEEVPEKQFIREKNWWDWFLDIFR